MEHTGSKFQSFFSNQILSDIKFYNIRETYLGFDPEHKWVIQGGIEFLFENGIVSYGWNAEMHLYEMIQGDLDELLGDLDVYEIDLDQHDEIRKLKGKEIENATFNWTWYQKMDEEMELTDEKVYIPQEIKLNFKSGEILQIAAVLFNLKENTINNAVFDPQGNLLITLNDLVEITEHPN
jgi:hypothetical protein